MSGRFVTPAEAVRGAPTRIATALVVATVVMMLIAGVLARVQDVGSVRVTSTRANIRAEASETSTVLTQVTQGTRLDLVSVEGDWFRVRLNVGPVRVEAYISKKVATLETPPPAAAAAPSANGARAGSPPAPAPGPAPDLTRDGMTVTMVSAAGSVMLTPASARVVEVTDKLDSLAKLAATLPAGDALPTIGSSSALVTYVWVTDGRSSTTVAPDRRPSFVAVFKDVPGLSPDDLTATLVRLTPAPSGLRVVAAARARGDEASRTDADWDLMKDLKQDVVRAEVSVVDRGGVRLVPAADLPPGDYAVVIRPSGRRKVAGESVLGKSEAGRVFGVIWDFSIQ